MDEYDDVISLNEFKSMLERKKDGLNHFNVISGCPNNEKEREYCKNHPQNCCAEVLARTWKDEERYAFTDWEFC